MDSDDDPVGHILSRREALKLLGVGSTAIFAWTTAMPGPRDSFLVTSSSGPALACVVHPQLGIGSHFLDDQLERSDIRFEPTDGSVTEGAPLTLTIGVFDVSKRSCTPLEGAQVDVWHCDGLGHYSGVRVPGFDGTGLIFLRGYQLTDARGRAQFKTIYPGWYAGRTVHIHFMIRTIVAQDQRYEFASQLFFSDLLTDRIHTQKPYERKGPRRTRNADDNIYADDGYQLLLDVIGNHSSGYIARINIGLDLTDGEVGAPDTPDQPGSNPPPKRR